jgi:hypothetical protein
MEEVLIRFRLVGDEAQALRRLSAEELRNPREQIRYILRRELVRRGLLPADRWVEDSEGGDGQV